MTSDVLWRDNLAVEIERRGWSTLAIFGLELLKPLGLFCGHALMLLHPVLRPEGRAVLTHWTDLLQAPTDLESLIGSIERARECASSPGAGGAR